MIMNTVCGQTHYKREELLQPFVKNFTSEEYGLSPQNWWVSQDKRGIIYVANNEGLLEYDGVRWKKIVFANGNALTTLAIDDKNKIYVGGYGDFGYMKADSIGEYRFQSLLSVLKEEDRDFEVIRKIFIHDKQVYFQGDNRLIQYHPESQKVKSWKGNFHRSFEYKNNIYIRDREKGLVELIGNELKLVAGGERFIDVPICFMLPHESGQMLIGTLDQGLMLFDGAKYTPFHTNIDPLLLSSDLYCGIFHNGSYIIGTLKTGLITLSPKGKCIQVIDESKGLQNVTVNYLFEDRNQNIWIASNGGISRMGSFNHLSSLTRIDNQKRNFLKITRFKNSIIALTNHGVYKSKLLTNPYGLEEINFHRVTEIADNECWDMLMLPNELLVSTTNYGIYSYDLNRAYIVIDARYQAYAFCRSKTDSNRVYIGLKDGIASIYKQGGVWMDEGKIPGVTAEIRSIAETKEGNLWLAMFLDGAIFLDLSKGRKNPTVKSYGAKEGLNDVKDLGIYIQSDGRFLFYHSKGLSRFNPNKNIFEPEPAFGREFNTGTGQSGMLTYTETSNKTGWGIHFQEDNQAADAVYTFFPDKNSGYKVVKNLFSRLPPTKLNHLFAEEDGIVWLADDNGLARLNLNIPQNNNFGFHTLIRRVIANSRDTVFGGTFFDEKESGLLQQPASLKVTLPFAKNSLRFEVAALSYDRADGNEYQFFLEGLEDDWSPWTKETQKDYTNLPEGSYKFKVRSRNVYGTVSQAGVYEFSIRPPWYRTWWAYLLYFLIAGGAIYGVFRWRLQQLEEDKRILEQKVEERTAEVVQQAKELEEKNHEITQINEEIIQQRDEILTFNEQITKQKEEIEHQNNEIIDSINYARRIQDSILPDINDIRQSLPTSFVLYRPKDVVSGDFFWFSEQNGKSLIAAVDCTGHGIPGAFMSVMGSSLLNQIVNEKGLYDPGAILNTLNDLVRSNLHQTDHTSSSKDGMDLTLAVIDYPKRIVHFGGANNPMYYIHNGELIEFKTNKYPIGGGQYEGRNFETQVLECVEGDMVYLFSDGYADQFGGPRRKKFMYGQFKKLLVEISPLPPDEQRQKLDDIIIAWMNETDMHQIDDILVIGIKF